MVNLAHQQARCWSSCGWLWKLTWHMNFSLGCQASGYCGWWCGITENPSRSG